MVPPAAPTPEQLVADLVLLLDLEPRGFGRGQIFTRDGRLVASVAQEGMLRLT